METTETVTPSSLGIALAIGIAIIAIFLSILALGRALAGPTASPGAPPVDGAPATVTVELSEMVITPSTVHVAAGGSLDVRNVGSANHDLTVRDTSVATADLMAGQSEMLDVSSLADGTYEIYCSVPGHEQAGMAGTLTIGGDAPEADPGASLTGMARAEWLRANYEASVSAFPAETAAMGNQPYEPEILPDGSKLIELTISEFEWEIAPGEWVTAVGYNEQVPGPLIKVDVGDIVTLRLHNALEDAPTSLHPHGVFQHPLEADGVGLISHDVIMPGESFEVQWEMQEVSVGMYHGHDDGVHQVINGAFGAWLVGDLPLPDRADNVVQEQVMVLNDAGAIGLTLNAKSFPATEPYALKQGEQMLLHYYNEGLQVHPMHLHNQPQLVVARDGFPLDSPYFVDTLNVAPGERFSVVVFAETPGVWVFHCHILTHVERADGSVFGMFTALIVE